MVPLFGIFGNRDLPAVYAKERKELDRLAAIVTKNLCRILLAWHRDVHVGTVLWQHDVILFACG